ncbi:hypothetical protein Acsp07_14220 [Actinomycetospora sp. NBRC 106378]|nr:hypothetical protein Acsp07_14220 [Actinomycetospora sp. NBRC 106378]
MDGMNRRDAFKVAGAGLVGGGAALGAAAPDSAATPVGGAQGPGTHLFHLTAAKPSEYDGGSLRGANEQTFPVLAGQDASVYFVTLEVGGIREPHWHPNAWELNFVVSGHAHWTVLGTHPDGSYHNDEFDAGPGDLVFAPTGFFHYFANTSPTDPLTVLIVFNSSTPEPNDDLGIVGSFNSVPRAVIAATFGIPVSALDGIPTEVRPVVITRAR